MYLNGAEAIKPNGRCNKRFSAWLHDVRLMYGINR